MENYTEIYNQNGSILGETYGLHKKEKYPHINIHIDKDNSHHYPSHTACM